ncbi:MAG: VOC family protein [Cyclobacteriaceae bacterium]|nr:VOC family protein [Cyclobacteriaceae bacterium]MDH4297238.1 VOC family protein [Cyclobacteriaceae bacterium]MDH5250823.1 VOC family protein [Cyclobacteriaceae bacterium]
MVKLNAIHHVAIICANYQTSKEFYTKILGFTVLAEHYRNERKSYKLDLALGDHYCVELFSFPEPPRRLSRPEACGLRHLAFEVDDLMTTISWLHQNSVVTEPIRVDEFTGKRFTFCEDPDNLPLEFYER